MTKLTSSVPKGDSNGLGPIVRRLIDNPEDVHVAVVLLDCSKLTINTDDNETEPTIRIRRIEVVTAADKPWAKAALRHALTKRTGATVLDGFEELDGDLTAAFGPDVDMATGEVTAP